MNSRLASCVLLTAWATASCGGTDYVRDRWQADSLDTSDGWIEGGPATREGAGPVRVGIRASAEFRNTYYDFPGEGSGKKDAKVFDAECRAIADVTQTFHDQVCMQGSGRLSSGETISFAKRDCACASVCPRSGQKICFEKLDPKQFPSGRGATGGPVTPLRSVAVDTDVIPLGTSLYVLEYDGLPVPGGKNHDGCFVAEDRGSRVKGRHLDVFTGDPATTKSWNQLVPSNQGVHVELDSPRCRAGKQPEPTEVKVSGSSTAPSDVPKDKPREKNREPKDRRGQR